MKKAARRVPRENLKITWYGHSAFSLQPPNGKTVLIDPWLDNPKAPPGAKETVNADVILVTHGHSDHLGNTLEVARRTNANVISIFEIYLYLEQQGLTNAQGMNKGGTVQVDGVKVTMVDAKHSSDIDAAGTVVSGGEAAGFVVGFENGFSVYHTGDTALFGDMRFIRDLYKPQLVLLPIGDLYTMGPREAAMACKLLNPKHIIGMHYGTFPVLTGTPAELKKNLPANMKKRLVEMEPGATVML